MSKLSERDEKFKSLLYPRVAFSINWEDLLVEEVTLVKFDISPNTGATMPTCEFIDPDTKRRVRCSCDMLYISRREALDSAVEHLREGIDSSQSEIINEMQRVVENTKRLRLLEEAIANESH